MHKRFSHTDIVSGKPCWEKKTEISELLIASRKKVRSNQLVLFYIVYLSIDNLKMSAKVQVAKQKQCLAPPTLWKNKNEIKA